MDLDVSICDSERIITEVQKRPALYDKATPQYSDKHWKQKLCMEICEAVVPNGAEWTQQQECQQAKNNHVYIHYNLFVEAVEYSCIIFV